MRRCVARRRNAAGQPSDARRRAAMSETHDRFDPYLEWLGVRTTARPPNHYKLLGIPLFEEKPEVIESAAERQMTHVRKFQTGPRSELSQVLLNQLAAAQRCLLTSDLKDRYDRALKKAIERKRAKDASASSSSVTSNSAIHRIAAEAGDSVLGKADPQGGTDARWKKLAESGQSTDADSGSTDRSHNAESPFPQIVVAALDEQRNAKGSRSTAAEPTAADKNKRITPLQLALIGGGPLFVLLLVVIVIFSLSSGSSETADQLAQDKQPRAGEKDTAERKRRKKVIDTSGDPRSRTQPSPKHGGAQHPPGERDPRGDAPQGSSPRLDPGDASKPAPWDLPQEGVPLGGVKPSPVALEDLTPPVAVALREARRAMGLRELDASRKQLDASDNEAKSDADRMEIARLRKLHARLASFWRSVSKRKAALEKDQVLSFRSQKVAVVRANEVAATLRAANGKEKLFPLDMQSLHPHLAEALVEDEPELSGPDETIAIGVFWAMDHQGNLLAARRRFDAAELPGSELKPYLVEVREPTAPRIAGDPSKPTPGGDDDDTPPEIAADGCLKIPSAQALAQARDRIRLAFGAEFSATDDDSKRALAARLLQVASETESKPERYVLFKMAQSLAVELGEAQVAFQAFDARASEFEVDKIAERIRLSEELVETVNGEAAQAFIELLDESSRSALMQDEYDAAVDYIDIAIDVYKRAATLQARDEIRKLRKQKKEVAILERKFETVRQWLARLADDPENTELNEQIGQFYCLEKREWQRGLPYLAKSGDEDISRLAALDLQLQITAEPQQWVMLGDQWKRAADNRRGQSKEQFQRRAIHWYQAALPELKGLAKTEVETKLFEVRKEILLASPDGRAFFSLATAGTWGFAIDDNEHKMYVLGENGTYKLYVMRKQDGNWQPPNLTHEGRWMLEDDGIVIVLAFGGNWRRHVLYAQQDRLIFESYPLNGDQNQMRRRVCVLLRK